MAAGPSNASGSARAEPLVLRHAYSGLGGGDPGKDDQQVEVMEQFEHQSQPFVDAAKNGHIPEQVRVVAEESVKRIREAYTSLSSAAQEGMDQWQRVGHANYKTAREMERKCLQNTATNVDAAFAAARSIAAARTLPEAARLYAEFVQQQFTAGSAQMQELLALSQRSSAQQSEGGRSVQEID